MKHLISRRNFLKAAGVTTAAAAMAVGAPAASACWTGEKSEVKIIQKLKEEGIDKHDLGREKFLERAWEWKKEYGGRIIEQLKKLGSSIFIGNGC